MRSIALVCVLACSTCFGQESRLRTTGDVDEITISARQVQHEWSTDAKITCFPELVANTPPNDDRRSSPDSIKAGEFGDVSLHRFKIHKIVNESTVLLGIGKQAYWLTGCETKGLEVNKYARVLGVVECKGPIDYDSPSGGTKRGLHLKLLNRDETRKHFAKQYVSRCQEIQMKDGTSLNGFAMVNVKGVVTVVDSYGELHSVKLSDVDLKSTATVRKQLTNAKSRK